MNEYANMIKEKLTRVIEGMSASLTNFVRKPGKDFTRNRKLPFATVMQLLLSMGGNSIYKELLEASGYDVSTATTSAFVQQRDKILPAAVQYLFSEFTRSFDDVKKYRGYRLFAVDGSDLNIAHDPEDQDTFLRTNLNGRGFNLVHLNAIYDLCSRLYVDAIVQPRKKENEKRALCDMVDRSDIEGKVIVVGDRGFESYNNFVHIENKGWNYLIRVKDINSKGIVAALPFPEDDEFDVQFERILTRKHTKEIKANPDIYRFIPSTTTFDYLDEETTFYPISFRVVRFKIEEDSYETVITNLKQSDFPPQELKMLYQMRWGIETSFRELKYSIGLVNFHAKKRDFIVQEIFARMTMYNFTEMVTSHIVISNAKSNKYVYHVHFTVAIIVCRQFLRGCHTQPQPDVEALLSRNILPFRPNRQSPRRQPKGQGRPTLSFNYRIV